MAILRSPSDLVVVACTAEFPLEDACHSYIIGASAHFETDFGVAYVAFETNAMKPVGENYRTHPRFFRSFVKYNIPILSLCWRRNKQYQYSQYYQRLRQIADKK